MLTNILIAILIIVTFLSLFVKSENSQKGFYSTSILGLILGLVLVLILTGVL
jgi:tetrahydromethanopterin S-methyltransferase subunit F